MERSRDIKRRSNELEFVIAGAGDGAEVKLDWPSISE
jgi:hypothetical protein